MKLLGEKLPDDPNEVRMTIGEHLNELRGVLIRSLIALVLVAIACAWPFKYLYAILARPLMLALRKHHQPESFLATDPSEPLLIYVKTVLIAALILSSPYILFQIWSYVAAGLYKHERRWVYRLLPYSIGLFMAGVLFMYFLMLPLCLDFLIGFSSWFPMPDVRPNALEQTLLGGHPPAMTQPAGPTSLPSVPVLLNDPLTPPAGAMWFSDADSKLKIQGADERVYSLQFLVEGHSPLITSHIKLSDYLWFVLVLTISFGLAFQMPLVVLFLARTGIVPVKTFRQYRKVVILVIVGIAGMIAPPDLMSHIALSGPMVLLFEAGLWLAARRPEPDKAASK